MSSRFPVNLIDNKYLPLFSRIILGGIFIYAAAGKILYPAEFSEAITNYQLVPVMFTNLVAIVLPWVELVAGLLLLNGFKTQSGNIIIFLLICVFSFGAVFAVVRGLDINCGCFTESSRRVGLIFLAEEAALFLMSTCIFFFDKGFLSIDNLLIKYYSSGSDQT
ncbi:MAG: MauE/DoxX family redox-associated membrane protein [Desulfobacterales bacterium]